MPPLAPTLPLCVAGAGMRYTLLPLSSRHTPWPAGLSTLASKLFAAKHSPSGGPGRLSPASSQPAQSSTRPFHHCCLLLSPSGWSRAGCCCSRRDCLVVRWCRCASWCCQLGCCSSCRLNSPGGVYKAVLCRPGGEGRPRVPHSNGQYQQAGQR